MPANRWVRRFLLLGVPVLVLAVAGTFYVRSLRWASTDDAYVKADKTMVAPRVSGTVVRVLVEENQRVMPDDTLLEIDDEPFRYAVDRARANVAAVRVQVGELRAQYAQKQTELDVARRIARFSQRELERQRELAAKKLVAASKLDDAEQAAQVAAGKVSVAERDLNTVIAKLGGDVNLPVEKRPEVLAAEAELARAELDLRNTRIVAPRPGIASKLPQVGDHLTAGAPALAIVSNDGMWIEANFKETDLARVREGLPVDIRIDTYGRKPWHGSVESIAQATGAEFALLPPQNASGNWVKVVQRIPVRIHVDTGPGDPPLRAGMSASVTIDLEARDAGPARTAKADR